MTADALSMHPARGAQVEPILEVRDLSVTYATDEGDLRAVDGVSFSVTAGSLVGLVGESGCGKSATCRAILGLLPAAGRVAGGSALLDGDDLISMKRADLRKIRGADIGFVAQNPFGALNPILRISRQFHNVVTAHRKASRAETRALAREMLVAVGISAPDAVLEGYAHQLSGGMAQRVVLAIALMLEPRLIIADEPTTALDVTIQRQILDLSVRLVGERPDRAMMLVTHDLGVVARYCDEVVVMYAGRVVETGPVARVFRSPAHPYTAGLLGSVPRVGHKLNSVPGTVPPLIGERVGCTFRDRCQLAFDRCEVEAPPLEVSPLDGSRSCSCHRAAWEVTVDGNASR